MLWRNLVCIATVTLFFLTCDASWHAANVTFILTTIQGATCLVPYNVTTDRWVVVNRTIACSYMQFSDKCIIPSVLQNSPQYPLSIGVGAQMDRMQLWTVRDSAFNDVALTRTNIFLNISTCAKVRLVALNQMNGYHRAIGVNRITGETNLYELVWQWGTQLQWRVQNASHLQNAVSQHCRGAKRIGIQIAYAAINTNPTRVYCDGIQISYYNIDVPTNVTMTPSPFYKFSGEGYYGAAIVSNEQLASFNGVNPYIVQTLEQFNPASTRVAASFYYLGAYDESTGVLQVHDSGSDDWIYHKKIAPLPAEYSQQIRGFIMQEIE